MSKDFEAGRGSAGNAGQPSALRRTLLKGCLYLPATPLLAMLGGCDESAPAISTFELADKPDTPTTTLPATDTKLDLKLPPFSTTDERITELQRKLKTANDLAAQMDRKLKEVEVTHVPDKLPARSKPKKVGIYSLQYNAFTQISTRKEALAGTPEGDLLKKLPGSVEFTTKDPADTTKTITTIHEGIEPYLKRALDNRFALLYRSMLTGFQKLSPKEFDVSFFTAPEFYWNIPFGDFLNEDELQVAGRLCQAIVTGNARTLISKFPSGKYGNIVLLPGTIATLEASTERLKSNGTSVNGTIYIASNHLTCTHNLSLDDKKYPRPAYMIWPKRAVSGIDFLDEVYFDQTYNRCEYGNLLKPNPTNPALDNPIMDCTLSTKSGLNVRIEHVSSSLAQSFDTNGNKLSDKFNNKIIEDLPFGIDICLDYSEASIQKDPFRIKQLDEQDFKLDFLIAAGMGLDESNYEKVPFIQYAIRNEGLHGKTGEIEVMKLNWAKGIGKRLGTLSSEFLEPLDFDEQKKADIPIDQTDSFVAPADADTKDIPAILDKMNPGIVKIWSLDVDRENAGTLVASKQVNKPLTEPVHFVK